MNHYQEVKWNWKKFRILNQERHVPTWGFFKRLLYRCNVAKKKSVCVRIRMNERMQYVTMEVYPEGVRIPQRRWGYAQRYCSEMLADRPMIGVRITRKGEVCFHVSASFADAPVSAETFAKMEELVFKSVKRCRNKLEFIMRDSGYAPAPHETGLEPVIQRHEKGENEA